MAAHITGIFPGATLDTSNLTIPVAAVHSLSGVSATTGDVDVCFGLIDTIAGYLLGSGVTSTQRYNNATATETDRIQDATTLRKDYTFRINLDWNSNTATNTMNVKAG